MLSPAIVLAAWLVSQSKPEPAPPGRRVDLGEATLFVPVSDRPVGEEVDLTIHLHGAPSVVEPAFVGALRPGALIEFNRKGLSRAYAEPFSDPKLFPRLIDAALDALKDPGRPGPPRLRRLTVSSFSAGFGGVREILKVPEHFARIDALVMADSIYAGYEGDPSERRVDPRLMDGFLRFAREAVEGRKSFLITHSAQVPGDYASTTETADFLIRAVGGEPEEADVSWGDGWTQARRFARGRFLVLGFRGKGGPDHMKHLRGIARLWEATPPPRAD